MSHTTASDGNIIYTPPGWLICVATANGKPVHGFKKLCLPSVKPSSLAAAKHNVSEGPAKAKEIKAIDALLNALSKVQAAAPPAISAEVSKPDESTSTAAADSMPAGPAAAEQPQKSPAAAEPAAKSEPKRRAQNKKTA